MARFIIAAVAVCSLCTAASAAPASSTFTKAKTLIGAHMADPSSLQFRNLRIVHKTVNGASLEITCGDYNAKNKFGGYAGFQTFVYEPSLLKGVLSLGSSPFHFFGLDGGDEMSHLEVFENAETTAPIIQACLV